MGIVSSGDVGAAWEFMRFLLSGGEPQSGLFAGSFPMCRTALEALLSEGPDAAGAGELLTLIGALEYRDLSGTTAAQIVCEEAEACFSGARSFGETAALVQNRVGLWLSEQFS